MASSGPSSRRKILIALDLDYTLFDYNQTTATWIRSLMFWTQLFDKIKTIATTRDTETVFMVATSKMNVDDICIAAAVGLYDFIFPHCPHQYKIDSSKKLWALFNLNGKLRYEYLPDDSAWPRTDGIPEDAFSHFMIAPVVDKSDLILTVANRHNIPAQDCILLDDTEKTLDLANARGIKTISFSDFCGASSEFIETNVPYLISRAELLVEMVKNLIGVENILMPSAPVFIPQFNQPEPPVPASDPAPAIDDDGFISKLNSFFVCR